MLTASGLKLPSQGRPGNELTHSLTLHLQGKDDTSLKALIAFGADINSLNGSRQTPLDVAVQDDNTEVVEFLATPGAFKGEQRRAMKDLHLGKDKEGKVAGTSDVAMSVKLQGEYISYKKCQVKALTEQLSCCP